LTEPTDDLLVFADDRLLEHAPPCAHPESPTRLREILACLREPGTPRTPRTPGTPGTPRKRRALSWRTLEPAPREALLRVHDKALLARLDALRDQDTDVWLSADTAISAGSVPAIELAAGAGILAVDALYRGEAKRAVCLTRPPGHHAKADRMMGACFLNNIAVAAAHARAHHGAERVMIVDWDVHHGNGTEAIFFADPDVLVVDSHQSPLYPDTGEMNSLGRDSAFGKTVNLPLPAGTGDGDLVGIYSAILPTLVASFEPELLLVSAGFDGHADDPVGGFELSENGYASLTALLRDLADRHCDGRLILLLEGGYNPTMTARSLSACVDILLGADAPPTPAMSPRGAALLSVFRSHHGLYWPLLRGADGLSGA